MQIQTYGSENDAFEKADDTGFTSVANAVYVVANATSSSRQHGGVRFPNIPIPRNARILTATLDGFVNNGKLNGVSLDIFAEAVDNAVDYASNADVVNRVLTTASVSWVAPAQTSGTWITSPDVSTVVQEIVNRASWTKLNALNFLLRGKSSGTDAIQFDSADNASGNAMRLNITWEVPQDNPILSRFASLDNALTRYFGIQSGSTTGRNSTETNAAQVQTEQGTFSQLYARLTVAPGVGKSWTFTVMKNGVATAVTFAITDSAVTGSDTTHSFQYLPTDVISVRVVPSGTPIGADCDIGAVMNQVGQPIMGGNKNTNPSQTLTTYYPLQEGTETQTTPTGLGSIIPTSGTFRNLRVRAGGVAGTSKSYTITMWKNGVAQSFQAVISGNTVATASDLVNTVAAVQGDDVYWEVVPSGTPNGTVLSIDCTFVPTVPGESIQTYAASATPGTGAANFVNVGGGGASGTWAASESTRQNLLAIPAVVKKLAMKTSAAAGSAKTWATTVRTENASTTVTCSISGTSAVTAADNTHTQTLAGAGSRIEVMSTPTSTPATVTIAWGFVLYVPTGSTPDDFANADDAFSNRVNKAASDSATSSDARTSALTKTLSDSVTASDADTTSEGHPVADTVSTGDAIAITVGKKPADSVTATDLATPNLTTGGSGLTAPQSDSVTSSDAITKTVGKRASDTATGNDAISKALARSLSDSITTSESILKAFSKQNTASATENRLGGGTPATPLTTFDRYVDQVNGLDTNSGLTPGTAWKTLAKVAAATGIGTGKTIGLLRGCTWRESLTIPVAGTDAAHPTILGAYGAGDQPKIKQSVAVPGSWSINSGSIYETTQTPPATCLALWVDETTMLPKAASLGAMVAGSFFVDATKIYVWLSDSSNPTGRTIDVGTGNSRILFMDKTFTEVHDLNVMHCQQSGAVGAAVWVYGTISTAQLICARRCTISNNYSGGILHGNVGGVVEDCTIENNGAGLNYPSGSGFGINFITQSDAGIARRNFLRNNYRGIFNGSLCNQPIIHHNIVLRSKVNNIDMTAINAARPAEIYNNTIWHRTAIGVGHGLDSQGSGAGAIWKNNLIYSDETTVSPSNLELAALSGTLTSIDLDYQLYWVTASSTCEYGRDTSTHYATYANWITYLAGTGFSGKEAHSVNADPLFTNLAIDDVTLKPNSPARNAGVIVAGITDGYSGSAPDIGAYEVVPLGDSATTADSEMNSPTKGLADIGTVTDVLAKVFGKKFADIASVNDAFNHPIIHVSGDFVTTSDTSLRIVGKRPTDQASVFDTVSIHLTKFVADSVLVVDVPDAEISSGIDPVFNSPTSTGGLIFTRTRGGSNAVRTTGQNYTRSRKRVR